MSQQHNSTPCRILPESLLALKLNPHDSLTLITKKGTETCGKNCSRKYAASMRIKNGPIEALTA